MDRYDGQIDAESFVKETLSMSENKHMRLRYFGFIFLILNIVLVVILMIVGYVQMVDTEEKYRKEVSDELESIKLVMSTNIKASLSDLFFLSDIVDKEINGEIAGDWALTEATLYSFIRNNDSYDQARFLDVNGMERIRINKVRGEAPEVVDEKNLQNKSDKTYFNEASNLSTNIAYISELDLNMENGQVEVPYKLVLRLATPVFEKGILSGVIVLNFFGSELLYDATYILKQGADIAGDKYFLLNGLGDPLAYIEWSGDAVEKSLLGFDATDAFKQTFGMKSSEVFELSDGVYTINGLVFAKATIRADATASSSNSKYGLVKKSGMYGETDHDESDLTLISLTKLDSYWNILFAFIVSNLVAIVWIEFAIIVFALIYSVTLVKQSILENAIKSAAAYDPLTLLYNRRFGMLFLKYEIRKIGRTKEVVTLFVIDVNNLKTVNDTCGHNSGDQLIRTVATRLKSEVRESDILCRIGGDEFIVAFVGMGLAGCNAVIERVRSGLQEEYKGYFNGVGVDFSYGGVEYDLEKHADFEDFIKEADAKMYEDKRRRKKGRNIR